MYLSQINTYPIKSTYPISVKAGYLHPTGIGFDRNWMLIDEDNAMLTSRKHPKLLHVRTRIDGSSLRVMLPKRDFLLPLEPKPEAPVWVKHWGEKPLPAWPQNPALDVALSEYLGLACRLVYSANLQHEDPDKALSFADAQPLLLTTTASLAALNERLDDAIGMDRFRTNLVINNLTADVEDKWQRLKIGACELEVSYPCKRCVLTTIDPINLTQHEQQEPLRTLAQYRRLDEGGVGFGINLTVIKAGPIAVGDTVQVLC
ncbi:MAG: MOSC domain-containing protein [Gammaproteobacteria bacterium]|nr:MOSC domain-containing protein [Gammaproteobacteria bacterium]